MPTTSPQFNIRRLRVMLLCFSAAMMFLTGCVEDSGDDEVAADIWSEGAGQQEMLYSLSSGRTLSEERMAGELEGLLPGEWVQAELKDNTTMDLNITFLGHDAVTGDIALLVSAVANSSLVVPTRVILSEDQALFHMPESNRSYLIDHIDADSLSLQELETGERFVYLRSR